MSEFIVRGYAGFRHRVAKPYTLLMATTHSSEASAAVEIDAWKARMRRGEVSHCELIDQRPDGGLTNIRVDEDTVIKWSWVK